MTDGAHTAFAGAQAEHVSFSYADEEVLHDLSLIIPEKKIVGITGRSGSGKSTFLRLLMRFWDVNTGTIRFGEEDIRRVNTTTLRAQESLVTQETELFNDTIENNIRIAKRDATREEVEAACKKAALDGFIRSLPKGYDTPVGELGGALSGGERQRIGVARAFLHDAPSCCWTSYLQPRQPERGRDPQGGAGRVPGQDGAAGFPPQVHHGCRRCDLLGRKRPTELRKQLQPPKKGLSHKRQAFLLHVYGSVIDGFEDLAANVLVAGNGGVAVVGSAGIGDGT